MLTLDKHAFTDSEMRPYALLLGHFNLHSYHTFAHLQSRAICPKMFSLELHIDLSSPGNAISYNAQM